MVIITAYSFGRMVIDGRLYSKDVIIFPDNTILSPWWRSEGHSLVRSDIEKLLSMEPEIIIAGTGASGFMQPARELEDFLALNSIEFVARPTDEAVRMFNEISGSRKTGGCFHLTC